MEFGLDSLALHEDPRRLQGELDGLAKPASTSSVHVVGRMFLELGISKDLAVNELAIGCLPKRVGCSLADMPCESPQRHISVIVKGEVILILLLAMVILIRIMMKIAIAVVTATVLVLILVIAIILATVKALLVAAVMMILTAVAIVVVRSIVAILVVLVVVIAMARK